MAKAAKTNFLTQEGYEKLVKELHNIKEIEVPKVIERIWEAKAMWDLSENSEYKSALEDRDLLSSRVMQIEELLNNVEIIDESKKKPGKIDYGTEVTVQLEDKKKYTITMVGSGEVEIGDKTKISFESPLGIAIRGKKAWDKVQMRIGTSRQDVKIVSIK